jgi:transcriptional regulator with XRE-family HTH domain
MKLAQVIGANIRKERERRGWSGEQLGAELGKWTGHAWSRQTVSYMEAGRRSFAAQELVIVSVTLGLSIDQLMETESPITLPSGARVLLLPDGHVQEELL